MESVAKTSTDILLEAADLLEEEGRWHQGTYFAKTKDGGCKMCAHGAIAYCGNPEVRRRLVDWDHPIDAVVANRIPLEADNLCLSTEHWIAKRWDEVGVAHYKAQRVGLTFDYNDKYTTTKQDVINKLREAAQVLL